MVTTGSANERLSGRIGPVVLVFVFLLIGGLTGIAAGADGASIEGNDTAAVSPEILDGDGEEVVLVYFGAEVGIDTAESGVTVEVLEDRADTVQEPLREYAAGSPGIAVERSFWLGNVAVVTVDHDRADVESLTAVEGVEYVGPNRVVEITTVDTPVTSHGSFPATDRLRPRHRASTGIPGVDGAVDGSTSETTYGLDQINAPAIWEAYDTRGAGTSVAVLDTGVDEEHPDLDVAEWAEFDEDGNEVDSDPHDANGHGTHVSGTVAGPESPEGDVPAYGVAPDTDLYHGKVLNDDGGGTFTQIIAGMEWAVEEDADVVSMSLGAEGYFDDLVDPVRNAQAVGTMVVASSGNDGEDTSGSPGNVYDATSVGASDENEDIAGFSSGELIETGDAWEDPPADWPDEYVVPTIAAPGVDVLSAAPGGDYNANSGTSMAAPHVSGAVALLLAVTGEEFDDEEDIEAIEEVLIETAFTPDDEPDEQDTRYGHGIVDAEAAAGTVEPRLVDYANEDGVVDTTGLRDAVDDWQANVIGTDLLQDVIEAWSSGDPVE